MGFIGLGFLGHPWFISKTSDKEREKLDKQIGRAFFANNFSFQSIENSEFVKAIQMLRPGYTPPRANQVNVS